MKAIATLLLGLSLSMAINAKDYFDRAEDVTPLLPGMSIPSFSAKTPNGDLVEFDADNLNKPFVLTFYRGGWCPYCNAHLGEMRLLEKELNEQGFDVFFISPDQPSFLLESLKDQQLKADLSTNTTHQLLSDASMEIAKAFKIAFKVEAATVEKYKQWGIDLEKASGYDHHLLPAPATFVVGKDGVIQFQYVNPDYKIRLAPSILSAVVNDYLKRTQ
ncbi:peroxiredoxin-like family protein [Marinicella sp. S1101]|uniref:peroxiredoxin-like family protein n=1 Tax=Marinicella marina TaxID=2996016 RepID=UPI002260A6D7|nr:peroxiredoxin-like family protein [Marinicella marina]MCX7554033.1 peroxiredoxin-like family protein [Marinicella marina]MDJ1140525.1 peroxiredoxin-like family protein [Marinicella marina]